MLLLQLHVQSATYRSCGWQQLEVSPCHSQGSDAAVLYVRLCLQATHEWQDGVLARIMRGACKDELPDQKWILFDGPVDTLWIESMNTTLDDNKLLTLLSGACYNCVVSAQLQGWLHARQERHLHCTGACVPHLPVCCPTCVCAWLQASASPCQHRCPCCLRLKTSARPHQQQSAGRG